MTYHNAYFLFIFVYLATRQMICTHSLSTGSDYIKLNWSRPKFLPEKYLLHVQYASTLKPRCTFKNERKKYFKENAQCLTSNTTSVRISDLRPSSVCTLLLLAVYNPASIDLGIVIRGKTSDEGISKRNLCLLDYHNNCNLLYVAMCLSLCMWCRK